MRFGFLNFLVGVALITQAFSLGKIGYLLFWLGTNFLLLGTAYFRRNPFIFGKRPDGTLPILRSIAFFPLHIYSHLFWHLLNSLTREPKISTIDNKVWIGRRLVRDELPPQVETIIDLTAEFREPRNLMAGRNYKSFPILDASTPDAESLRRFIDDLPTEGNYIHCAQGHGRTGLFTIAFLIMKGFYSSIEQAKMATQKTRPRLRLNRDQGRFLAELFPSDNPNSS